MPLTTYYLGQKEDNDLLNCESRCEVCSVTEKSHSTKMHGLGISYVENVLLQDIC
jgi:hypothetical protein